MSGEASLTSANIATLLVLAGRSFSLQAKRCPLNGQRRQDAPACCGMKESKQEQQGRFQGAPCPMGGKDPPSHTAMGWGRGGDLEGPHQREFILHAGKKTQLLTHPKVWRNPQ